EVKRKLAATPYSQSHGLAVLRENQIIPLEGGIENIDALDSKQLQLVLNNWEDVVEQMRDLKLVTERRWPAVTEIVQKEPRVLKSYKEAEEYTGIPERRLRR